MAQFEKAIPKVLRWEGGYVNHPADPGGATNRGIILTIFVQYAAKLGLEPTVDALKTLTEEQAKIIYKDRFWNRMLGDQIVDQSLANIAFDGFVNCGYNGLIMLQEVVGVKMDGLIGKNSLAVINTLPAKDTFEKYKARRIKYYNDLATRKPEMVVFLKGWLKRINDYQYDNG